MVKDSKAFARPETNRGQIVFVGLCSGEQTLAVMWHAPVSAGEDKPSQLCVMLLYLQGRTNPCSYVACSCICRGGQTLAVMCCQTDAKGCVGVHQRSILPNMGSTSALV